MMLPEASEQIRVIEINAKKSLRLETSNCLGVDIINIL
jgi:hypothetical protein